ncbi:glutathione S-transferase C-terminal domain-containing protein [Aestuariispira insulae]|uniref:Putative glutathione S-transferase n=1 Tax=Aestuariispira insulae TaxID=1461337 RepID=A0A3D9HVC2_9PROT|nr:glutathione S-transferase C-terminal domain-containing protein [Aestuariispira insulae]RED53438.1 putative glutathione S-transferase [Aestuariispira insulae]
MGMLVKGRWRDEDQLHINGHYQRPVSVFDGEIEGEHLKQARNQPGRYVLIGSASCPWSHRCILVRAVEGLEGMIPIHLAHGPRVEGYALDGGKEWPIPGTRNTARHLHQLYSLSEPAYTGRSTVPVLWDRETCRIVSNESSQIVAFLAALGGRGRLFPTPTAAAQEELQLRMHEALNNGVYRAGFAESQEAYDEAVVEVFTMMDELEERLGDHSFLMGKALSYADLQLFVTLVRFDPVYYILHRCCLKRLVDYPRLWRWARRIYQMPGVSDTVDWGAICRASYANDTRHAQPAIVPVLPLADWWQLP